MYACSNLYNKSSKKAKYYNFVSERTCTLKMLKLFFCVKPILSIFHMVNPTTLFLSNSQAELMQGYHESIESIMSRCLVTFLISRLGSAVGIAFLQLVYLDSMI